MLGSWAAPSQQGTLFNSADKEVKNRNIPRCPQSIIHTPHISLVRGEDDLSYQIILAQNKNINKSR